MSLSRPLLRQPPFRFAAVRRISATPEPHHRSVNSWKPSRTPKEAAAQLAFLRRDYERKMREIRKEYIKEMEMQRVEKSRKDEARKEALRIANEQRKAAKDAKKAAEAIERRAADEEFRQILMKERAEKLEYWRMREKKIEDKKEEKKELLRRQSSLWIDESKLESKILVSLVRGPVDFP